MRRVVTGWRNGKSVILEDTEMPTQEMPVGQGTPLWFTVGIPNLPIEEVDDKKQLKLEIPLPGEIRLGVSTLLPDEVLFKKARERGIDPVQMWRQFFRDDYGMHTTDTVDYDIILSGELWMEVDDGIETHLKTGDCVIQNGTRHAWRNKSSENCIMATVMVGAKRKQLKKH